MPTWFLGLTKNKEYGAFSKAFYEESEATNNIIDELEIVYTDGYTAMWKYTAKFSYDSSAQSDMSSFYTSKGSDLMSKHSVGFETIMLILSEVDCGGWWESANSQLMQKRFSDN